MATRTHAAPVLGKEGRNRLRNGGGVVIDRFSRATQFEFIFMHKVDLNIPKIDSRPVQGTEARAWMASV